MTDKPELQPPSQPRSFTGDANSSRYRLMAIIGFAILAIAAFVVVVILPDQIARQTNSNQRADVKPPVQQQQQATGTPLPVHEIELESTGEQKKIEAQTLLKESLKQLTHLENEGVEIWGSEPLVTSYSQVLESLEEANDDLDDQRFDQAAEGYRQTLEKLEQLFAGRSERIQRALQAGDGDLSQLDSLSAIRNFEIALAADPSNEAAKLGKKRAENLTQVLRYMAKAKEHEAAGELDLAKQMVGSAISLDRDFQPARDDLGRVDDLIEERDYMHAMSDAISALNQKEIDQAKQALDIARNLRPHSPDVRELEQQLENTTQAVKLRQMDKLADRYEQEERWEDALSTYIKALSIDSTAAFAQKGKLRAERLLSLNRQVQNYLSNPDDLQATKHMDHARKICQLSLVESDSGPKLREKTVKLLELIEAYKKHVSVLIQSDGMTDVRIFRIGMFKKFDRHHLTLRPGRYKALGTRSGFRDVSKSFKVPAGGEQVTVSVYCKEKI